MVGQMTHPSSPDKHGGTVYNWVYLVPTYPTSSTDKFFITATINMRDENNPNEV
jgi:hypothetical protein